jgi:II/X family phage/plasmid replication protein
MIDWITALIPFNHQYLNAGRIISIDGNGIEEWNSVKWSHIEGSYSSKIMVRSEGSDLLGHASHLRISGNPAKFLQGHNVFGSDDLASLMIQTVNQLCNILDLNLNDVDRKQIKSGEYDISRIDINYGYHLKTRSEVKAWIRAMEFKSTTRSGRPRMKGTTLYFMPNSRRWSIKFYNKGDELEVKGHQLSDYLLTTPIPAFADNLLRCELTLRTTELGEINCKKAKFLTPIKLKELYSSYLGRIDMHAQLDLSNEIVHQLRRPIQASYLLWKDGCDLRHTMKETTFYAHRKELLSYNIDISNQPDNITHMSNVVPLIRVLEAQPISTPNWAYKLGLVAG